MPRNRVAGRIDDAAGAERDDAVDDRAMRSEDAQRVTLVLADMPAVTDGVRGEDAGEASLEARGSM